MVEDDAGIRYALEAFLELEGHSSISVDRGEAALPLLRDEVFDILFLDLNTEGMSAVDFITAFNELFTVLDRPKPRIGLLSAVFGLENEAARLNVDFFVKKPFSFEDLSNHLKPLPKHTRPRLEKKTAKSGDRSMAG